MKACYTLAAVAASLVGSAACAQLRFDLIGPVFTSNWPGSTDINEDGRVVVGMDGTGQVWRWERGVGVSVMPQLYYPPGSGQPCQVTCPPYVSANGLIVVMLGGGQGCEVYQRQVTWTVGQGVVWSPSGMEWDTFRGCSAAGVPAGTRMSSGYFDMLHAIWGAIPFEAYVSSAPGCTPSDSISSRGYGVTPDGYVVGQVIDCDEARRGGVWRGGTNLLRLTQEPKAGSWGAEVVISATHRWTAATDWQPLPFLPGSTPTDISWDGRVVVANAAVGPTTRPGFSVDNGPASDITSVLVASGTFIPIGVQLLSAVAVSGDGRWVTGRAVLPNGQFSAYVAELPAACDPIDFNHDTLFPDTLDIADFLLVFGGGACPTGACGDIDFNNDGLFPDTADIDALLSVFSGGPCL